MSKARGDEVTRTMGTKRARLVGELLTFECPACKDELLVWGDGESHPAIPYHEVNVGPQGWRFNRSLERPTLSPSVRTRYGDHLTYTCHFFVREGRIEYCSDSTHKLAGKTVDMVILGDELPGGAQSEEMGQGQGQGEGMGGDMSDEA